MKLASWNIRTLLDIENSNRPERRSALVASELARYKINLAGLQETRLSGVGQMKESSHTFFWSGRPDGVRREAGVGFAIENSLVERLTASPVPVSDRIMTLRTAIGEQNFVTFIVAYAPTLCGSDEEKDHFYGDLENILSSISPADKIVLLGDLNARVGDDCDAWSGVLGRFGRGSMNNNGLRLLMKCTEHHLAITNTFFRMPEKWYGSWQHPRSKHVHLLDYIVTRRSDITDFHSTRVVRGAECGTDHFMVRSVVTFSFKRQRSTTNRPHRAKLAVVKLKDPNFCRVFQQRCSEFAELIQTNMMSSDTVQESWEMLKSGVWDLSKEVLGTSTRKSPDWFMENECEINNLIDKKNNAYQATLQGRVTTSTQQKLTVARRNLQQRLRELKNEWWSREAASLQQYADAGDLRNFYGTLRKVYGPEIPMSTPVLSRDGMLLANADDIKNRWKEHYEELLNHDGTANVDAVTELRQLPVVVDLGALPCIDEVRELYVE